MFKIGRVIKYKHPDGTDRQVLVYYDETEYKSYELAELELNVIQHNSGWDSFAAGWTIFKVREGN